AEDSGRATGFCFYLCSRAQSRRTLANRAIAQCHLYPGSAAGGGDRELPGESSPAMESAAASAGGQVERRRDRKSLVVRAGAVCRSTQRCSRVTTRGRDL